MSFYERYDACCREKGILPASQSAADQLHCTKSAISALAKNGNTPRGDIVANAARMLDVSADYLLGLVDLPHPIVLEMTVSDHDRKILSLFHALNDAGVEAAYTMLQALSANRSYIKDAL